MKTSFRKSFSKDLDKPKDRSLRDRIRNAVNAAEAADRLSDIPHLKKLAGADDSYRVRVGEYRLGIIVAGEEVVFVH